MAKDESIDQEERASTQEPAEQEEVRLPDDIALFEGDDLASLVEALLFASSDPLSAEVLAEICKVKIEEVDEAISKLKSKYDTSISGFSLCEVAGQFQLRTDARFSPFIRVMRAGRPRRLSHAALETLAVIAYRQPVVRSDIEKIRGVDVTPTLKTLLDRKLIKIVGHQSTVGQPALFGTTDEFLKLFGLNSLSQLPTLRDIKEFERDPGETDSDAASSAPEHGADLHDGRAAPLLWAADQSQDGENHEALVANFSGSKESGGLGSPHGDRADGGGSGGHDRFGEKSGTQSK